MSHVAVLPARIRQRWLALAIEQLYATLLAQEQKIQALQYEANARDEEAEFWHTEARRLQEELCALTDSQPGLTRAGHLLAVKP